MILLGRKIIQRVFFIVFLVGSGCISLNIISCYLPYNLLIAENKKPKRFSNVFTPQGWAFFTRSPRTEIIELYKLQENELRGYKSAMIRGTNKSNFYGLKKDFRISQLEISMLGDRVQKWKNCNSLNSILEKEFCSDQIINNSYESKIYCGNFLIVRRDPVPYVYRNITTKYLNSAQYSMITIKCS